MSEPPTTRASLILRLQRPEDEQAWQEFVEIYQPLIYRLAMNEGQLESEAIETVQTVIARVAQAVNEQQPNESPNILPNLSQNRFRDTIAQIARDVVSEKLPGMEAIGEVPLKKSPVSSLVSAAPSSTHIRPYDLAHERQVFAWASQKVKVESADSAWQAFWMTTVEQLPAAEVADRLNLSAGAILLDSSRVMAELKRVVDQHIHDDIMDLPTVEYRASGSDSDTSFQQRSR